MDLFKIAEKKAPAKKAATKMKTIVPVELGTDISRLQELRDSIKSMEAEAALLEGNIKPVAEEKFLELYQTSGIKPESFVLQSDDGGQMLVIVQDKYLKLEPEKEAVLQELYPEKVEELIDVKKTYSFNTDLLTKHYAALNKAIVAIKSIPEEDKANLIEADEVRSIKKGSIAKLNEFEDMQQVFSLIRPQLQLKNQNKNDKDS